MAFGCSFRQFLTLVLVLVGEVAAQIADPDDPVFSPECPPLPCPLPPPGCQRVDTFYWRKQQSGEEVLCQGCDQCSNLMHTVHTRASELRDSHADKQTGETVDESWNPACVPLPCPPPYPGCKTTVMTHYWSKQQSGESVLCPGCEACVDPPASTH